MGLPPCPECWPEKFFDCERCCRTQQPHSLPLTIDETQFQQIQTIRVQTHKQAHITLTALTMMVGTKTHAIAVLCEWSLHALTCSQNITKDRISHKGQSQLRRSATEIPWHEALGNDRLSLPSPPLARQALALGYHSMPSNIS